MLYEVHVLATLGRILLALWVDPHNQEHSLLARHLRSVQELSRLRLGDGRGEEARDAVDLEESAVGIVETCAAVDLSTGGER